MLNCTAFAAFLACLSPKKKSIATGSARLVEVNTNGDNPINALKPLANPQKDGDSPITRRGIMDWLRRFIQARRKAL